MLLAVFRVSACWVSLKLLGKRKQLSKSPVWSDQPDVRNLHSQLRLGVTGWDGDVLHADDRVQTTVYRVTNEPSRLSTKTIAFSLFRFFALWGGNFRSLRSSVLPFSSLLRSKRPRRYLPASDLATPRAPHG